MEFITKNFQFLVIVALFVVIILQRNSTPTAPDPKPIVITVVDTSWKSRTSPITNVYPTVTNNIPAAKVVGKGVDTMYLPSPDDSVLRIQYQALRDSLLAQNIYTQTLKYDSSSVTVTDTVHQNRIAGRSYSFNLKYPEITTTTTIKEPYKPVNQFYVGAGLTGNPSNLLSGAKAGIIFKNKKDHIYQVDAVHMFNYGTHYGVSTYWKLKLKK